LEDIRKRLGNDPHYCEDVFCHHVGIPNDPTVEWWELLGSQSYHWEKPQNSCEVC